MTKSQAANSWYENGFSRNFPLVQNYVDKLKTYPIGDFKGVFDAPSAPSIDGFTGVYDAPTTPSTSAEFNPIPEGLDAQQLKELTYQRASLPLQLDLMNQFARTQSDLAYDQMLRSAGPLRQAYDEAERRSRFGAEEFLAFKERQPTAAQARRTMASSNFTNEAGAAAAQLNAAVNFARRYGSSYA